ncbi:MAG: MBL fold metallo-hydrolase [Candidatus Doudnabacteria bacterium]
MKITFYGAAQTVTGSKHLIESEGFRILLDCGLHQGEGGDRANRELAFGAESVDSVILSHAHADHCGMLPVLVRNGFKGKIYCTSATADIAKYILVDSAMVQQQESNHTPVLYTKQEAENVFPYFEEVPYFRLTRQWTRINDRIRFKFYDAGHILGSAITYFEITENGKIKSLAYTGDIGQGGVPILHDPEPIAETVDTLICEATYGGSLHRPLSDAAKQLKTVIDFAIQNKSKILVPAFALGRTQELIYILHDLTNRKLVEKIPIYVDSPLGLNITEVFARHQDDFDVQTWTDFGSKQEVPLIFASLTYIRTVEESKALNAKQGPFMVISSSGMMEGGRILHHLKNGIEDPKNAVLITGYQSENTLGRKIQQGASQVEILGSRLSVNAKIVTMNEFSAHGDQAFLANYIDHTRELNNLFLVHTEMPQALSLEKFLLTSNPGFKINIPSLLQSFEL